MNLLEWAKAELDRIPKDNDNMQEAVNNDILEIIEKFSEQGHSGLSAGYVIGKISRLLNYKPITPLTGEEDEWYEANSRGDRKNKRCTSVFQKEDGKVIDIDAIIVSDNGGITWYTSGRFYKEISFPYYPPNEPEKVYIEYTEDVPAGFTSDNYETITDKPDRIKTLYEEKRKEFDEAWSEEE